MEFFAISILNRIDKVRALFLRHLSRNKLIRQIYCDRALRLFTLHALACGFYLIFASALPLWVLLIGPIFWGVPHLFASLRSLAHHLNSESNPKTSAMKSQTLFRLLSLVWFFVMIIRLAGDLSWLNLPIWLSTGNRVESVAAVLTIFICWRLFQCSFWQGILSLFCVSALAILSFLVPGATLGALILIHNLVAYFYWLQAAADPRETKAVWASIFLFLGVHVLIFSNALQIFQVAPWFSEEIQDGVLSLSEIGKLIAPWSENAVLLKNAVIAYAFGQSLHYFVWLKAIPDSQHTRSVPTTFRQSVYLLRQEYGGANLALIFFVSTLGIFYWLFFDLYTARTIYFCVAAFHGYMELAALPLVLSKRSDHVGEL